MASPDRSWRPCAALAALLVAAGACGEGVRPAADAGDGGGIDAARDGSLDAAVEAGDDDAGLDDDVAEAMDAGPDAAPPIVVVSHTERRPGGPLAMRVNIPALTTDCVMLPGAPCADVDRDGLVDAWERTVLARFRPRLRFDENEHLLTDPQGLVFDVGRVFPVRASPLVVRAIVVLAYSKDYGNCSFTAHNGDTERVALELGHIDGGRPGDVEMVRAYTAAHEGSSNDQSRFFSGPALGTQLTYAIDLMTREPRWVIFPAKNKHGSYANVALCEGVSSIPCLQEDCNPDGVPDPTRYERLPGFVNAGEVTHPINSDLSAHGFPNEDAWADQPFCGGLGGTNCSPSVRSKLLDDPFL